MHNHLAWYRSEVFLSALFAPRTHVSCCDGYCGGHDQEFGLKFCAVVKETEPELFKAMRWAEAGGLDPGELG